jgi:hypothetical protein
MLALAPLKAVQECVCVCVFRDRPDSGFVSPEISRIPGSANFRDQHIPGSCASRDRPDSGFGEFQGSAYSRFVCLQRSAGFRVRVSRDQPDSGFVSPEISRIPGSVNFRFDGFQADFRFVGFSQVWPGVSRDRPDSGFGEFQGSAYSRFVCLRDSNGYIGIHKCTGELEFLSRNAKKKAMLGPQNIQRSLSRFRHHKTKNLGG